MWRRPRSSGTARCSASESGGRPRARGRRRAAPRSRPGPRRPRPARRRRRPRQLHRRADRARGRARPGARARPAGRRASRPSTRSPPARPEPCPVIDARRGEVFSLVSGRARCLAPDDARGGQGPDVRRRRRRALPGHDRGTAEASCRPTTASSMSRAHASTRGSPARAARPSSSSRSTPRPRRREGARLIEIQRLAAPRPDGDRGDRAQRLPDAVVALDVRRRALEAVLDLPRRLRGATGCVGYLITSRYVDAWHVMNVAVAPVTGSGRDRDGAARPSSSS